MKRRSSAESFKGYTTYIYREDEEAITTEEAERIYKVLKMNNEQAAATWEDPKGHKVAIVQKPPLAQLKKNLQLLGDDFRYFVNDDLNLVGKIEIDLPLSFDAAKIEDIPQLMYNAIEHLVEDYPEGFDIAPLLPTRIDTTRQTKKVYVGIPKSILRAIRKEGKTITLGSTVVELIFSDPGNVGNADRSVKRMKGIRIFREPVPHHSPQGKENQVNKPGKPEESPVLRQIKEKGLNARKLPFQPLEDNKME